MELRYNIPTVKLPLRIDVCYIWRFQDSSHSQHNRSQMWTELPLVIVIALTRDRSWPHPSSFTSCFPTQTQWALFCIFKFYFLKPNRTVTTAEPRQERRQDETSWKWLAAGWRRSWERGSRRKALAGSVAVWEVVGLVNVCEEPLSHVWSSQCFSKWITDISLLWRWDSQILWILSGLVSFLNTRLKIGLHNASLLIVYIILWSQLIPPDSGGSVWSGLALAV